MMLVRFDPARTGTAPASTPAKTHRATGIPMDAYQRDGQFVMHFDLPGVDPSAIDITVDKNRLTIRAERDWTPAEGDVIAARERSRGAWSRELFLGDTLDRDHLEADYDRGVLTLKVPVTASKARKIEVSLPSSTSADVEV